MTRVVKLVFIDDDPAKRVVCDESNRTARVVKIPRSLLALSSQREELKQVGLYFLVGDNDEESDRPYVYVGESESLFERLKQHDNEFKKFTWKTALVVLAQDAAINKAHAKFLENKWYQILLKNDAVELKQDTPAKSALNESDQAVADDFSNTAHFLIGALGYRFFETIGAAKKSASAAEIHKFQFITSQKKGNVAIGYAVENGFLVEMGSKIDPDEKQGTVTYWKPVRDDLKKKKIIGEINGVWQFLQDWTTSSPSRAAAVVYGGSVNGQVAWKSTITGLTFKEWAVKNSVS